MDAALLAPSDRAKGRGYTYAFLVLSEQLSDPLEKELQGLGVQLLGPHGGSQKVRVPTDPARLRAIAAVSGVESIAYARKDQKVERAARDAAARYAKQLPGLPVIVSAFDKAALEELRGWLTTAKATVGRVDAVLLSISAVVPRERLDAQRHEPDRHRRALARARPAGLGRPPDVGGVLRQQRPGCRHNLERRTSPRTR